MARSPQTFGWEDFKPRELEDGTPTGRQLFSYDQAIRLDGRRRTAGDYEDWVFVTVRQRNGIQRRTGELARLLRRRRRLLWVHREVVPSWRA
jgi:hypothetical protein